MANQNNVKKFNFLFSYAYIRNASTILIDAMHALAGSCNIMIDSGAFTNYKATILNAKAQKEYKPITLKDYMEACKGYSDFYQYIQMDVIGNPDATKVNYEIMRNAGLTPMPVFTRGADWSHLAWYATQWRDICFGGIAFHARNTAFTQTIAHAHAIAGADIRFHLLGFARYPLVMSLPVKSYDSSSYAAGQQYGRLAVFTPQKGITGYNKHDNPKEYLAELRRHNISAELLRTGHWNGQRGMPTHATMHSHLKMMQYVYNTKGQLYFLAIPNFHWLEVLLSVYASMNQYGFDYPEALERFERVHTSHASPTRTIELLLEYANV